MSLYRTNLAVEALWPGDEGYDDGARGFFGTGRPDLIIRPRHPDDVAAALAHAARHDLAVAVRSGGHGPLGPLTATGGMVIDLVHLDGVDVLDAGRRLVRVGGGATWGAVGAALDGHHLALTSGDTAGVGVGGLTLGGGVGWMVRRYGLAIDNLVGARVVTADGRLLKVSQDEHADLFWALRGGGGNFGIVVDFDFRAQPVTDVHFGTVTYRLDDAAGLVTRWRDAMRVAPDELSSTLVLPPPVPQAPPTAMVLLCYSGEPDAPDTEADAAIGPLLSLGTATAVTIAKRRYAGILEIAQHPPKVRLAARNTLVAQLDAASVSAVAGLHTNPVPTAIALRSLGGAVGRVAADATAFAHRNAEAMIVALLVLPETATQPDIDRALQPWRAVAARGIGTYLNFQGSTTAADLAAAYPPATLARLCRIKRVYDPDNRFARNHNIEPR